MITHYSSGMHDFVLRECEVGTRVAFAEDMETCGFNLLLDPNVRAHLARRDDHQRDGEFDEFNVDVEMFDQMMATAELATLIQHPTSNDLDDDA